jgi:hypothetical protein
LPSTLSPFPPLSFSAGLGRCGGKSPYGDNCYSAGLFCRIGNGDGDGHQERTPTPWERHFPFHELEVEAIEKS